MANATFKIIKYEGGNNNVIVYKSEICDFTTESVLIVDESQQAILHKDGQAEGPFLSGRHVLPTNNVPKFRERFAKLFSRRKDGERDGSTPFTCDVFFVNMVNDISVGWGTPSRIMVKDPVYNELVNVGANGNLKVKVSDAMRFVVSVVGGKKEYSLDSIAATVRSDVLIVLKTYLANTITESKVSLLEINGKLMELSKTVERKLNERLEDYGLTTLHFNIEDISVDAQSQARLLERQSKINRRSDVVLDSEADTAADYHRTVKMADAKAREREIQGYSYQDEQYWKAQQDLAKNPGIMFRPGMFMPGMIMPGMMPGMGYPGMMPGMPGMPQGGPAGGYNPYGGVSVCPSCGNQVQQGAAFCPFCGNKIPAQQPQQPQQQTQQTHAYNGGAGAKCPKCDFPLLPRTTICPNCNYDLSGEKNEK